MNRARAARGFTLIEILVVVLIIGIIITFAALSLGNRTLDSQLDNEGERLHQLFALAVEDAEVQGLELGWRYTPDGYEFLVLNQGSGWQPFEAGPLRERPLPGALYIDLSVEGRTVPPAGGKNAAEPQVLLLSSGDASPFRLDLHAHGYQPYIRLEGDALGRLRKQRFDQ
ncbi:MAG TPA: type II secretion system minor pseudopilin GspH [Nevskiaceae bacterium]|nr:type II secretion system minor pseudopilin GspH [Nevskiaceae bacterium]